MILYYCSRVESSFIDIPVTLRKNNFPNCSEVKIECNGFCSNCRSAIISEDFVGDERICSTSTWYNFVIPVTKSNQNEILFEIKLKLIIYCSDGHLHDYCPPRVRMGE